MNNFITIKELYDYAVKNNIENIPFGIGITDKCSDCGESVEPMSAVYIDNNIEVREYWENNKKQLSNFVWINLDSSKKMICEED